jgi:DNA-binding MarR family transcriptional regulator
MDDDAFDRPDEHAELIRRVGMAIRRVSAQSVIISEAVAARFAMHPTDLESLDLIVLQGPLSAGALARSTGLSTGSVTALIDRLERAGYVERVADPADRRRVLVRHIAEAVGPIAAVYRTMEGRMGELWSEYSESELATVADFLERSLDLAVVCTETLKAPGERRAAE